MKVILGFILSLLIISCTKQRPQDFVDENMYQEVMSITDFRNFKGSVILSNQSNEDQAFKVYEVKKLPDSLSSIISNLYFLGQPEQEIDLKFEITPQYVFVIQKISSTDPINDKFIELSFLEDNTIWLRKYAIPVKNFGIIENIKNDLKEKTHKIYLKSTDFSVATHIHLDLRLSSVLVADFLPNQIKQKKEIIAISDLNHRIFKISHLEKILQTNLHYNNDNEDVLVKIDQNTLLSNDRADILIYKRYHKNEIKNKQIIEKLKSPIKSKEILSCNDHSCVYVLERKLIASTIKIEQEKSHDGYIRPGVNILSVPFSQAKLIRISSNTLVENINNEHFSKFNAINTLKISSIRNREFLFRRTFEDGSNTLQYISPGGSGELEIVRFEIEDHRVVVRRSDSLDGRNNTRVEDKEELLSIPARYYRVKNDAGVELSNPEEVHWSKADFIHLDWTKNTLSSYSSPLFYYGNCFFSNGYQQVTDVRSELETNGILSFSIYNNYTFKPECMSYFKISSYYWHMDKQQNFFIKERISFKIYNQEHDKIINQDLPFHVQKLLGFGFFTVGRLTNQASKLPNHVESQKSFPVIHDFSNNKVVKYYLGGLSDIDHTTKNLIIESSIKVIDDWNESLHRAFKGTKLERSKELKYIELIIDENENHRFLGDLDRNFIWHFHHIRSDILGLANPSPNPRTGIIESSNVLMYTGNILSYIYEMKNIANIVKKYEDAKNLALKHAEKKFINLMSGNYSGSNMFSSNWFISDFSNFEQSFLSNVKLFKNFSFNQKIDFNNQIVISNLIKPFDHIEYEIQKWKIKKENNSTLFLDIINEKQKINKLPSDLNWLFSIIEEGITNRSFTNESAMTLIAAKKLLEVPHLIKSEEERKSLIESIKKATFHQKLLQSFNNKRPGCAMLAHHIPNVTHINFSEMSTENIFKNWYAMILSHEIGHILGLTHNFKGSFDQENFKFQDELQTDRQYSTVMDYFHNIINYHKPGPYDVFAIRAGYTGIIETKDGTFVSLNDIRSKLPETINNLWNLNFEHLKNYRIKHYEFCTDIDVGFDPICNPKDVGTSPQEILKFYIKEYLNLYPIMNNRENRLLSVSLDEYLAIISSILFKIRMFLDETFYQLTVLNNPNSQSWILASLEAYKMLLNIKNTPDTKILSLYDIRRFYPVYYQVNESKNKKKMKLGIIEGRNLQDVLEPSGFDRLRLRGYEFDKALSILFLTKTNFNHPRYNSSGIYVSFADLERILFNANHETSILIKSLTNDLMNVSEINYFMPDGVMIKEDYNSTMHTHLTRMYSLLATQIFINNDVNISGSNYAHLFQIGTSMKNYPNDRIIVTPIIGQEKSQGSLKFWAPDYAWVTQKILNHLLLQQEIIIFTKKIAPKLAKLLKSENSISTSHISEIIEEEDLNSFLILKNIIDIQKLVKHIPSKVNEIIEEIETIRNNLKNNQIPLEKWKINLYGVKNIMKNSYQQNLIKDPFILFYHGIAMEMMENEELKILSEMLLADYDDMELVIKSVLSNIHNAAKFSHIKNPELAY